jgi:hypothetical protein
MRIGIVAGLLSFGFLKLYGEPQVDRAIAFETQMDETKAKNEMAMGMAMPADEPELVSRPVQASWGLLTGVMVYSTAFGGLFALAFAFSYGRFGGRVSPRVSACLLAMNGFIAMYLVPNLKYPANPPSVGNPDTIVLRTQLFREDRNLASGHDILGPTACQSRFPVGCLELHIYCGSCISRYRGGGWTFVADNR